MVSVSQEKRPEDKCRDRLSRSVTIEYKSNRTRVIWSRAVVVSS